MYKSSVIWNSVKSIFKIDAAATSVSILKLKLKTYFLNKQLLGDAENWLNYKDWPNYILFFNSNHKILYFA